MSDNGRPTDSKLQKKKDGGQPTSDGKWQKKKDGEQIVRAKQLFKHRVHHFKSSYGPTVARRGTAQQRPSSTPSNLSVGGDSPGAQYETAPKSADEDVVAPPPPPPRRKLPTLAELRAEKQTLCEELQAARQAEAAMMQIIMKQEVKQEEEEEQEDDVDVREALCDAAIGFAATKEALLAKHKALERQWEGLVGSEVVHEKDELRRQIDSLQKRLNAMVAEQKRFARDFQDGFRRLQDDFQGVRRETEAPSDALLREKQQQQREHVALQQKFNALQQKVKDVEEKLKNTRTKFQQVHVQLLSNQKTLSDAAQEKVRVECELDSAKGERLGQERARFAEKSTMAEDLRGNVASMDRGWTKEREELFQEQKNITEHLFAAQNRGEDLDDELEATRQEMREQREALRDKERSLEETTQDNRRLKEDVAQKDEALFRFRKNVKAKDTEINELRNEVRELSDELDRLLDRKKKRFTLKGTIKKALQRTMDRLVTPEVQQRSDTTTTHPNPEV